jgi:hypothetical protein
MNRSDIRDIQKLVGAEQDGVLGPETEAAIDEATAEGWHIGLASSFADPADVRAFRRCKAQGKSDNECFGVGDNAIGYWKDDTSEGTGKSVAVPPDDMIERWGSKDAAHLKQVLIQTTTTQATAFVKDTMPWKRHITNGAVIDCNPDTCAALNEKPPMMIAAKWKWA